MAETGISTHIGSQDPDLTTNMSNPQIIPDSRPGQGSGCCSGAFNRFKSQFKEQRLPAWTPIYSSGYMALVFLAIGLTFALIGGLITGLDQATVEYRIPYTSCTNEHNVKCVDLPDRNETCLCNITLTVTQMIPKPVFVQYELTDYYQNHRRYVASRDDKQLRGDVSGSAAEECSPYDKAYDEKAGEVLPIAPCGAIANSLFNDSFELKRDDDMIVTILETGIAWKTDHGDKFRNPPNMQEAMQGKYTKPPSWPVYLWELDPSNPDNNGYLNERLEVWMRTASMPEFRKPWGRIDHSIDEFKSGIPVGEYTLTVQYNYPTHMFGGEKFFIITNSSVIGSHNGFLGIAYLIICAISLLVSLLFFVMKLKGRGGLRGKSPTPKSTRK